jgi:hypothetical protein
MFLKGLPRYAQIIACVLLILLAAYAGHVWGVHRRGSDSNLAATDGGKAFAAVQQALSTAGNTAVRQYGDYKADTTIWYAENTPAGKSVAVSGYAFKLNTAAEPQLRVESQVYYESVLNDTGQQETQPLASVSQTVVGALLAQGYQEQSVTKSDDQLQNDPTGPSTPHATVQNMKLVKGNVICSLSQVDADYYVDVSCSSSDIDHYLAAQMQPFVNIEAKAKKLSVSSITAGPMTIRGAQPGRQSDSAVGPSETAGYNLAEVLLVHGNDRRVALYYSHNGQWHFITEATDEYGFSCNDVFADPDARRAMFDQVCYDSQIGQHRVDSSRHY